MSVKKPSHRSFFIKLWILTLVLLLVQHLWQIALPWQSGLFGLSLALLLLAFVGPIGRPLFMTYLFYKGYTSEAKRFWQGVSLVLLLIATYRLFYVAMPKATDLLTIGPIFLPPGDHFIWGVAGTLFLVAGLITPVADFLWRGWMGFAVLLHAIVSRIVLTLAFLITVIPVGVVAKIVGKKFLERRFRSDEPTYWVEREQLPFSKERYHRHF